ncbi:ditrans,polycis-undecaprenyl-diphosphate synthase ((2E,6E)-farnesyl-diphosphate specific) [uncultured Gammaproteobacteria bacterium]
MSCLPVRIGIFCRSERMREGISEVVQAPPRHVAIIMDGNGRWARTRGLPRVAGHRKGVEAARSVVKAACDLGISTVTLYSFSQENWGRPESEVAELMQLLRLFLRAEIADLHKNGVRLRVIGDRERLAPDIIRLVDNAEQTTCDNTAITLVIALSYGARQEIVLAAKRLAEEVYAGRLQPSQINEENFAGVLQTNGLPDPDLIIRTSGEKRLSNFLLWQGAYAELVFLDTLWPDFTRCDLEGAIREFHRRDRRYGASVGTG